MRNLGYDADNQFSDLHRSPDAASLVRLSWTENMVKSEDTKNAHRIMRVKPFGKHTLRRTRLGKRLRCILRRYFCCCSH